MCFYIDKDIFDLGGPDFCQGRLPTISTFDDKSSPRMITTLCGVPQPKVEGEFVGQKLKVIDAAINSYTHSFILQLPLLTQNACGRELQVTATGYNGISTEKTKIFVKNCKFDLYLILGLHNCQQVFHHKRIT